MAQPKNRPQNLNLSRNNLLHGAAVRFLSIAEDHGKACDWYNERLEVIISMMLLDRIYMVAFSEAKPIGGVTMIFDWERHSFMIDSEGEFLDPESINQFGTLDSVTDTIEAIRKYIDGLMSQYSNPHIEIWYQDRLERLKELGESRFDQLLNRPPRAIRPELEEAKWTEVSKAMKVTQTNRTTTLGDLSEASFKAWKG